LHAHQEAGDTCVLVSASLDVYLQPWADQQGIDAVLCSGLEINPQQRVTGRLTPANCYGPEKARRIRAWLDGRQPSHITAYGDSRGDEEMFALADTVHLVRG
jgi:phosphatidylglycerophosphatase C